MKIIIAGAGLTGFSVVEYLSKQSQDYDIVVIDKDINALKKLSASFDVQTVHGLCSSPDILTQADAKSADVIMALTNSDEVNMIVCQMAYSLFNIPKKIAKIESKDFLSPLLKKVYNSEDVPIDYIISINEALANILLSLIEIPQAREAIEIKKSGFNLLSFSVYNNAPIINTKIADINKSFDDMNISVLAIIRDIQLINPTQEDIIKENDEVVFIIPQDNIDTAIKAFGKEIEDTERVLIFGVNDVTDILLSKLQEDNIITNIKIIEEDFQKAQDISLKYGDLKVISGPILSDGILSEANIEKADVTIALTKEDKDNILISILSNSMGVGANISLLDSRVYDNLLEGMKQNISVDRSSIIVSQILPAIRKPKLNFVHVLSKNFGEIWGLKIKRRIDSKKIGKIKGVKIGVVIRGDEIIYNLPENGLHQKDYVILYTQTQSIKKLEELF